MMRKRNFWFTFVIAVALGSMMLFALQQDGSQLEIVWSKQWGTAAETGSVDNIALDGQGNIYIVGVTEGNLFGQNQGKWDIFVIKLDSNGKVLWSKQLGSAGKEEGVSGAVDGDGNIYLLTLTEGDWFGKNLGSRDIVLLKLSSSGEILWEKGSARWRMNFWEPLLLTSQIMSTLLERREEACLANTGERNGGNMRDFWLSLILMAI